MKCEKTVYLQKKVVEGLNKKNRWKKDDWSKLGKLQLQSGRRRKRKIRPLRRNIVLYRRQKKKGRTPNALSEMLGGMTITATLAELKGFIHVEIANTISKMISPHQTIKKQIKKKKSARRN